MPIGTVNRQGAENAKIRIRIIEKSGLGVLGVLAVNFVRQNQMIAAICAALRSAPRLAANIWLP
jgi:hypothetical protein